MPTNKKAHDKDRYYHLARDQGFRARSAFKLIQIDKRYDVLSKARVCIDLCAAPGSWCQVAAKAMKPGSIVVGVDLLPIREIRNVTTIVSDITTADCRNKVNQALAGWPADVVLCDGAPNIGSDYTKDAYVQNELVLAALKTATDHLVEGGTFISKIYRSKVRVLYVHVHVHTYVCHYDTTTSISNRSCFPQYSPLTLQHTPGLQLPHVGVPTLLRRRAGHQT
jgi:AdoMet-dependent rRNA methyltransferase SPB1